MRGSAICVWRATFVAVFLSVPAEFVQGEAPDFVEETIFEFSGFDEAIVADFNGDGFPDIAADVAGSPRLMLGTGDVRNWTPAPIDLDSSIFSRAVADIDGDGVDDLVAQQFSGISWISYAGGAGESVVSDVGALESGVSEGEESIAAGDFDGDGDVDVVSTDLDSIFAFVNDGASPPSFMKVDLGIATGSSSPPRLMAVDFEQDGVPEIVGRIQSRFEGIRFDAQFGVTRWELLPDDVPSYATTELAFGDVDLDGDTDIVHVQGAFGGYNPGAPPTLGHVRLLLNDGSAQPVFTEHPVVSSYSERATVDIADVTGDGLPDIVMAAEPGTFDPGHLVVHEHLGTDPPRFRERVLPWVTGPEGWVTPADVDVDGDIDLLHGSELGWDLVVLEQADPVWNVDSDALHATLPLAIHAAAPGDALHTSRSRLAFDRFFSLATKPLHVMVDGPVEQRPGSVWELGDGAVLESSDDESSVVAGAIVVPAGADAEIRTTQTLMLAQGPEIGSSSSLRTGPTGVALLEALGRNTLDASAFNRSILGCADIDGSGRADMLLRSGSSGGDRLIVLEDPLAAGAPGVDVDILVTDADVDILDAALVDVEGDGRFEVVAIIGERLPLSPGEDFSSTQVAATLILMRVNRLRPLLVDERTLELGIFSLFFVSSEDDPPALDGMSFADLDGDADQECILFKKQFEKQFGSAVRFELFDLSGDVIESVGDLMWRVGSEQASPFVPSLVSASEFSSQDLIDFDRDGDIDVVYGEFYENMGGWPPIFEQITTLVADGIFVTRALAGDFDGDGDVDLISEGYDSTERTSFQRMFTNEGGYPPTFGEPVVVSRNVARATPVERFDADGDGDLDILARWSSGNSYRRHVLLTNDGLPVPTFTSETLGFADKYALVPESDGGGVILQSDELIHISRSESAPLVLDQPGSVLHATENLAVDFGTVRVINQATLRADAGLTVGPIGAALAGDAFIDADVVSAGHVEPEGVGELTISGDYRQRADIPGLGVRTGDLRVRLDGADAGALRVFGLAELAGGLVVTAPEGFDPEIGTTFTILAADGGLIDAFDVAFLPGLPGGKFLRVIYDDGPRGTPGVTLIVDALSGDLRYDDPDAEFLVEFEPRAAATGDLDGVAGEDLVLTLPGASTSSPGSVLVLFNGGNTAGRWNGFTGGPTGGPQQITVGREPRGVTIGEFDGESGLDVAVVNRSDDSISILGNDGAGNLAPVETLPDVGEDPRHVAAADVDRDGDDDLVLTALSIAGDLGPGDAGGVGVVNVLLNTGDARAVGFLGRKVFEVGGDPDFLDPTDFDNDKDTDVAVADRAGGRLFVLENVLIGVDAIDLRLGASVAVGRDPVQLRAADLNDDGLPDLASADGLDGTVSVSINESAPGTIGFRDSVQLPVGERLRSLAVLDMDQDGPGGAGDPDIAVVASDASGVRRVRVLRNDSAGSGVAFSSAGDLSGTEGAYLVEATDVNGDEERDLVVVNDLDPSDGARDRGEQASEADVAVLLNSRTPGDATYDGAVDFADLNIVLEDWGSSHARSDFNLSGTVDFDDLNVLLDAWASHDRSLN